jgi:hypothetical protein
MRKLSDPMFAFANPLFTPEHQKDANTNDHERQGQ